MPANLTYNGKLWLEADGQPIFGPGRAELLERIRLSGSIRQAAQEMNMSYRQAWQAVAQMNAIFPKTVVFSHRGGKGGGYAEVTEFGKEIASTFREFHQRFHEFLQRTNK